MTGRISVEDYAALIAEIGDGVPNTEQYRRMSGLTLDVPAARPLAAMDPFAPGYKQAAMDLYLEIRGRAEDGYVPRRDEKGNSGLPENLWTGLIPWSFQDPAMVSEHLLSWGHIFSHLRLPPGGSVLEYGPGSGQILLMLARMGYHAYGVDIDNSALDSIRAQSAKLELPVETEQAKFGEGFEGKKFDGILFYEAFHHAFDFDQLLLRLHDRLAPGGRLVLCGEPIVPEPIDALPYPWGPRLDALSVFCIQRFGWMELGFTHDFFMRAAALAGWDASFHPFPNCGRAAVYVLDPTPPGTGERRRAAQTEEQLRARIVSLEAELSAAQATLAATHTSTSWRLTTPLRASKQALAQASGAVRRMLRP